MIQHTVAFRMHPSADEAAFWDGVAQLQTIDGPQDFQTLRQVGRKTDFTDALSMIFDDQAAYDRYNEHPLHVAFVEEIWKPNVADFMELDYVRK